MNPLVANIQAIHAKASADVRREIVKGSIVKYQNGWMEVTAKFKNHVNLGSIFRGKTTIKKVPLTEVTEDRDAWYEEWTKSETYRSM